VARYRHVDVFALSLEPGAYIEESVDGYQLKHLMRCLSANSHHPHWSPPQSRVRLRVKRASRPWHLLGIGRSVWSLTNVLRQLLDNGADARQLGRLRPRPSPRFDRSDRANSASLFDFFIERGADIHGGDMAEVS
jgi:hypothetical protein